MRWLWLILGFVAFWVLVAMLGIQLNVWQGFGLGFLVAAWGGFEEYLSHKYRK